ncbi:hypothetical protein IWQ61_009811 [Dispira simplex]|nr:hypothetical protein IWQ61_009811 [Dispira simplex]
MNLDSDVVPLHSPASNSSLDSEMGVAKTHKDQTAIEVHDWLSLNMSVSPIHYQLGDQALQKNLGSIPQLEEQYLWVPKVNGIVIVFRSMV